MKKRTGKRAGKSARHETEEQKKARLKFDIRRLEELTNLKKQAVALPGRIGFFCWACYSICLSKKPDPEEISEARKIGPGLLSETNKCLRVLTGLKYKGPETVNAITQLRESKGRLQRALRGIKGTAKKGRQEK